MTIFSSILGNCCIRLHSIVLICCLVMICMSGTSPAQVQNEEPDDEKRPTCIAERTAKPPVIDGRLDEECWMKTIPMGDFRFIKKAFLTEREEPEAQTEVKVLYDDEYLYIGVKCLEPYIDRLQARVTEHDGGIFADDVIEVFVDPDFNRGDHYQFVTNPLGAQYDGYNVTFEGGSVLPMSKWDIPWVAESSIGKDSWTAEMAIPFFGLGITPEVGERWGFNISRERQPVSEFTSWSQVLYLFLEPSRFGVMDGLKVDFKKFCFKVIVPDEVKEIRPVAGKLYIGQLPVVVVNQTGKTEDLILEVSLRSMGTGEEVKLVSSIKIGKDDSREVLFEPELKTGKYRTDIYLKDASSGILCYYLNREFTATYEPVKVTELVPGTGGSIRYDEDKDDLRLVLEVSEGFVKKDYMIRLAFKDKESQNAIAQKDLPAGSKELRTTLPIRDLKVGNYELAIRLCDADSKQIYSSVREISKTAKPAGSYVRIDENNNLIVDGKPFFTFGWYNELTKQLTEVGFNSAFCMGFTAGAPDHREIVRQAGERGVKYTLNPYPNDPRYTFTRHPDITSLSEEDRRKIEKVVFNAMGNPGLLAWYLQDEPGGGASPSVLEEVNHLVRKIDPYHPTYIVHNDISAPFKYKDCSDVVSMDCYLYYLGKPYDMNILVQHIEAAKKAVKGRQPIWIVIQAFDGREYGQNTDPRYANYPNYSPTFTQLRGETYISVIHGVKGIIYHDHRSQYTMRPEITVGMNQCIAPEIKFLEPVLVSSDKQPVKVSDENIHVLLREHQGNLYLFAVNSSGKPVECTFELPGVPDVSFSVISEERKVQLNGQSFSDRFGPWDTHIYTTSSKLPKTKSVKKVLAEIEEGVKVLWKEGNKAFYKYGTMATASSKRTWDVNAPFYVNDGFVGVEESARQWKWDSQAKEYKELKGNKVFAWTPKESADSYPAWLDLSFPCKESVGRVVIHAVSLGDYNLQYFKDNEWVTLKSNFTEKDGVRENKFASVETDKIRLWIEKPPCEIIEIEVYEQ